MSMIIRFPHTAIVRRVLPRVPEFGVVAAQGQPGQANSGKRKRSRVIRGLQTMLHIVLRGLQKTLGFFWPIINLVFLADLLIKFAQMFALWNAPGHHAALLFLLHFGVYSTFVWFVRFYGRVRMLAVVDQYSGK